MNTKQFMQIGGIASIVAFTVLITVTYHHRGATEASRRGQEVYASHDCTDCHLSLPILLQKRAKNEVGLIRTRKTADALAEFMASDKRHSSFQQMSPGDRNDLLEFLKSLSP